MRYFIELKRRALKDLRGISAQDRDRIVSGIAALENDLSGDVKRLTHFSPEYRLRVGDFRILFEVEGTKIIVYRILHRRESYR